jgi:hypothetical protein
MAFIGSNTRNPDYPRMSYRQPSIAPKQLLYPLLDALAAQPRCISLYAHTSLVELKFTGLS